MSDLSQQTQAIRRYLRKNTPWFIHHNATVPFEEPQLPLQPPQTLCIFLCKWESLFTRQHAGSGAQHGMKTDSRRGKQQGQKDEASCPRTVTAVHLANTNWHRQE